jgi:hypothetical protein
MQHWAGQRVEDFRALGSHAGHVVHRSLGQWWTNTTLLFESQLHYPFGQHDTVSSTMLTGHQKF